MVSDKDIGPLETVVRRDVRELGNLIDIEPSLAQLAYSLARAIDACDPTDTQVHNRARELRLILTALREGRSGDGDEAFTDMGSPV